MIKNSTADINTVTDTFTAYLIAEINCAILRAKLLDNDLVAIGIALKAGLIDADGAIAHLHDCGALRLVALSSAITSVSTS
jgi:hypothetical protein